MSYDTITPSYFQLLQPGDPWHAGSQGWTQAPYPGWGNNPNLVGPARQGVHGLGQAPVITPTRLLVGAVVLGAAWYAFGRRQKRNYRRNRSGGRSGYRRNRRWSRAYKDKLPDSAFLIVEPGGEKITERGKRITVPRSKRKLPYKNLAGDIDLPHLRNAIARAPLTDVPRGVAEKAQRKGRRLLDEVYAGKIRKVARSTR